MKTSNCHIKDSKKTSDYIYCGRGKGSKWKPENCSPSDGGYFGNPIVLNQKCNICYKIHNNGGATLSCYEKYLVDKLKNDKIFNQEFYQLKGKVLVCFCKPKACHTDIMIKYLDEKEEIN